MPITLYHVSFNVDEPLYKKFIPRIPDNTINEEDTENGESISQEWYWGQTRAPSKGHFTEHGNPARKENNHLIC